ncbi:LysM peptidoglycan-binding domain-containing protein [Paenibacillus sp. MBLB4367]|uniref:LysM peptidoglycan-binding domain-containing protein n=1 Tax=Paenibacillus sp. MBLB4367 TaxID=3384767 RepID=UPI0039081EAD
MKIHIVKKGESLYSLSKKYNVELSTLIEMNPQLEDPNKLDIGMKIKIPSAGKPAVPHPPENVFSYVVKQGDSLWKISKEWGIPLKSLLDTNPQLKNPDVLLTGQVVYIPKSAGMHHQMHQQSHQPMHHNWQTQMHQGTGGMQWPHYSGQKPFTGVMPAPMPVPTPMPAPAPSIEPVMPAAPAPQVQPPVAEAPAEMHEAQQLPEFHLYTEHLFAQYNIPAVEVQGQPAAPEIMAQSANFYMPFYGQQMQMAPEQVQSEHHDQAMQFMQTPDVTMFQSAPSFPQMFAAPSVMPMPYAPPQMEMPMQYAPPQMEMPMHAVLPMAGGCGCGPSGPPMPYAMAPMQEAVSPVSEGGCGCVGICKCGHGGPPIAQPFAQPEQVAGASMSEQQPWMQQPMQQQPMQQPMMQEPMMQQPMMQQPMMQQPMMQQPMMQEPMMQQPMMQQPMMQEPMMQEPMMQQPMMQQPMMQQPMMQEPMMQQPMMQQPMMQQPMMHQPMMHQPGWGMQNPWDEDCEPQGWGPTPTPYGGSPAAMPMASPMSMPYGVSPAYDMPMAQAPGWGAPVMAGTGMCMPGAIAPVTQWQTPFVQPCDPCGVYARPYTEPFFPQEDREGYRPPHARSGYDGTDNRLNDNEGSGGVKAFDQNDRTGKSNSGSDKAVLHGLARKKQAKPLTKKRRSSGPWINVH